MLLAAGIFDHPGVLLLFAVIALVRWLFSRTKAGPEETQTPITPPPPQPISRGGETTTEEERIRRFLQALGQPAGAPPPKVTPRPRQIEPRIFPRLPKLKTVPPPLPGARVVPPPLPIEPAAARLAPVFEVQDFAEQRSSEPPPEAPRVTAAPFDARLKLGTPQDLRTAIVLREIFGPPRSLQPVDLTSVS
ncbi:MAG TPA: hypothetical protein VF511_06720 [Chthoniobacterales bacterium]|jgi:hypothetical protein